MIYHSTRDEKLTAAPTRAVLEGIAPDGGLYVCDPGKLDFDWQGTLQKDTMSMAADILGVLLPDFQEMNELVRASYAGKFASDDLTPLVPVGDPALFFRVVRGAFAQRRKTLINSLSSSLTDFVGKEEVAQALRACNLTETIRGERLTFADFAQLTEKLQEIRGS